MPHSVKQARELLEKYRQGKCTDREIELLHQWYGQLEVLPSADQEGNREELGAKLEAAVLHRINRTAAPVLRFNLRLLAAASVAALILLSGLYWFSSSKWDTAPTSGQVYRLANTGSAVKKAVLPDGTQVWLNANSVLSWSGDFGKKQRQVQLEGEGYFNVVKDKSRPFLVVARGVTTKVLGTIFNVEAYPGEERLRVALVQGKVQLNEKTPGVPTSFLLPGQVGSISKGQTAFHITHENTTEYGAWIRGGFVLTDLPLEDALHRICNKYGYSLRGSLPSAVRQKAVTASFEKESPEEIITSLLYVNHIEFSIEQKVLIIKP